MTFSIPVVNGLRVAVITLAILAMILMALRAWRAFHVNGDRFAVWATSALIDLMLFTVIVEWRQYGEPLKTWWGLPMLAIGVLLTLGALLRSKV